MKFTLAMASSDRSVEGERLFWIFHNQTYAKFKLIVIHHNKAD